MIEGGHILRPVSPWFISTSLAIALLFNFLPLGNPPWLPDFVLITLIFWTIYQPRKVGVVWAFLLGFFMDVHAATIFGQHALMYSIVAYFGINWQRRVLGFGKIQQAFHVFPLFFLAALWPLCIRWLTADELPFWAWATLLRAVVESALWPLATRLLLAPQRRPTDVDPNRPL